MSFNPNYVQTTLHEAAEFAATTITERFALTTLAKNGTVTIEETENVYDIAYRLLTEGSEDMIPETLELPDAQDASVDADVAAADRLGGRDGPAAIAAHHGGQHFIGAGHRHFDAVTGGAGAADGGRVVAGDEVGGDARVAADVQLGHKRGGAGVHGIHGAGGGAGVRGRHLQLGVLADTARGDESDYSGGL